MTTVVTTMTIVSRRWTPGSGIQSVIFQLQPYNKSIVPENICTATVLRAVLSCGLDWIEQGLTSHFTHFRSFRRRWGDCSRSQSPQCVWCWVVCATGVYVYYLKGTVSVC